MPVKKFCPFLSLEKKVECDPNCALYQHRGSGEDSGCAINLIADTVVAWKNGYRNLPSNKVEAEENKQILERLKRLN